MWSVPSSGPQGRRGEMVTSDHLWDMRDGSCSPYSQSVGMRPERLAVLHNIQIFCIALGDSPTAFHRKCQPGTLSWGQNAYWSQRLFQHIETSEHQVRNSLFGWYFGWFDWLLCGFPGKKRTDASLTSPSSVKLDKSLCPFMCMSENLRKQHCLLKSKQILNS